MALVSDEVRLTSFLLKVASRCNLDCDYCYVYHHADQGWRLMPRLLDRENQDAFALRLAEYVQLAEVNRCVVIFHGGEPLLMGASEIAKFAHRLRRAVGADTQIDFSVQTNGLLLTAEAISEFRSADIGISLSLDGPREVNDLHRTSRNGRSSFNRVMAALDLLKDAKDVFAGVISVIDPRVPPRRLLEFFSSHSIPKLDFLLPDAHHLREPPGRNESPDLYGQWLIEAFDAWFDEFPELSIRTFEGLLDCVAGLPSRTDAFGFGDVSLITVETDGSYHDLDVLKIVGSGVTSIGSNVRDTPIADVARSPVLAAHRELLRKDGLCATCHTCDVVDICGGGSIPHRYGAGGFNYPTVYCREMKGLIRHARARVQAALEVDIKSKTVVHSYEGDLTCFEFAESAGSAVEFLWSEALNNQEVVLRRALETFAFGEDAGYSGAARRLLERESVRDLAQQPGAVAWSSTMLSLSAGSPMHAVDGSQLVRDGDYITWLEGNNRIAADSIQPHAVDPWLRAPFGSAIVFEDQSLAAKAKPILDEAYSIIRKWRPHLFAEMRLICHAVQFVRDPSAHPEKIVSFSDNSVPGALFVSVAHGDGLINPYDLADSLVHEHRHQKLYLLERLHPVVEPTSMRVKSPWREELRPPTGLFHAIFVFVELRRFWAHVLSLGVERIQRRAISQLRDTDKNLLTALETLKTCPLTETGRRLATVLEASWQASQRNACI